MGFNKTTNSKIPLPTRRSKRIPIIIDDNPIIRNFSFREYLGKQLEKDSNPKGSEGSSGIKSKG